MNSNCVSGKWLTDRTGSLVKKVVGSSKNNAREHQKKFANTIYKLNVFSSVVTLRVQVYARTTSFADHTSTMK